MSHRVVSLCLLAVAAAAVPVWGQTLYGTLTGNVTDPSNAPVPNASVEALNTETGVARKTITDASGIYNFGNLQPGNYKVTVSAPAFQTASETNIRVNPNEVRRADAELKIAQASQEVTVNAAPEGLQTDRADVHTNLTTAQIQDLPYVGTQGRNFQSLYLLVPGASPPNETNSDAGNPQRAQQTYVNGISSTANATKLDGTTIAYPWLPRIIAYVPPSDAIETVNVVTNDFDAEQGQAGGAAVNVIMKSGTNALHGSAYEYNINNHLTARNYFDFTGRPVPKNVFNQFGFSIGGPVYIPKVINGKNKLFFFGDFERSTRRQFVQSPILSIPTTAMRNGDFSATGTTIYDPQTGDASGHNRSPFPGNVIPSQRIDPAAAIMAGLIPAVSNGPANDFTSFAGYQFDRDNADVKVNYNPTDRAMIFGRYSISPMDIFSPQFLGKAGGDAFGPNGQPGQSGGRVQSAAAGVTYTLSPRVILDANAGYTRQNIGGQGDVQNGNFGLDTLHIPGTNGPDPQQAGIPAFYLTGLANLGNSATGSPFLFRDNQYTVAANLGWTTGKHNLRFGMETDKSALNHFQPQGGTTTTPRGAFSFNGTLTALNGGAPPGLANSWADFLLGLPSSFGKVTQFVNPNALRFSSWAVYARDQWQVTPRLTVSYGLRWEHYPIWSHDNFGAIRFDPTTGKVLIGGRGDIPNDTGADPGYKNFAPRFGIAYRLGPSTVIRSGYGITVDPDNFRNQRNDYPASVIQNFSQPNQFQFASAPGAAQATLRTGIPAATFPDISSGVLPLPTSASTATFPAYFNRGYIQTWNFIVQHAFAGDMVAEAGYVGSHAVHAIAAMNINAAGPGGGNSGRQLFPVTGNITDINQYTPFGSQKYNALQTKFTKRFGENQVGVRYTFSRAINTNDDGDNSLLRNFPAPWSSNMGLAGFDRTHNFELFEVVDLPVGKGHKWFSSGVTGHILGGWQISSILSRYGGTPFTVTAAGTGLNAPGQTQTADQVKPTVDILGGHGVGQPYFDPTAFLTPAGARFGTAGRNIIRGPGLFNLNTSVSRTFSLKERLKLELRGDAFNLTNTPQFVNPGGANGNGANNGTSVSSAGLLPNGTVDPTRLNGFATITSATNPRTLMVSGRITF